VVPVPSVISSGASSVLRRKRGHLFRGVIVGKGVTGRFVKEAFHGTRTHVLMYEQLNMHILESTVCIVHCTIHTVDSKIVHPFSFYLIKYYHLSSYPRVISV
jgi:hypothetical protein